MDKKEIVYIRIDEIIPNRFQPRLTFNEEELKELSESIKMYGIIQPLVLRRVGDKYEIIAGERRYKASQLAGLQVVPALVVEMDDQQSAEVALVENLQRKDLSPIEKAQSYKKLLDMGYTQEKLAERMGVSQSSIANTIRLLNLSIPVKDALLNNKISERHARSLLSITDANTQIAMLNRIISERLTVRQTDDEINKLLGNLSTENEDTFKPFDVDVDTIKNNSQNVIEKPKLNDIDMLLRPENSFNEITANKETFSETKDSTTNEKFGELAINPFQEVEPEIMNFEFEKPNQGSFVEAPTNSLIEEFRKGQDFKREQPIVPTTNPETGDTSTGGKSLTRAINTARDEVRNIENMGFNVDTEEFDFEDMYQIIIKIKKD